MDRQQAKELEALVAPFVENLKKQYNIKVKWGIRYGTDMFNITIKAQQAPEGTDPTTEIYRQNALKYGHLFGISQEMVGKKNRKGETLLGVAPNRSKYPIALQQADGKIVLAVQKWIELYKNDLI